MKQNFFKVFFYKSHPSKNLLRRQQLPLNAAGFEPSSSGLEAREQFEPAQHLVGTDSLSK
jgi:hypothetical protein